MPQMQVPQMQVPQMQVPQMQVPQMPQRPNIAGQIAGGMVGGMVPQFARRGPQAMATGDLDEDYDNHLRRWGYIFGGLGVAWFAAQVLLSDASPIDALKGIFKMDLALMLFFLAVPVLGAILALISWINLPPGVKAVAHLVTGGTIIGLLLAQPGGEGGAQAMLGWNWVRYLNLIGMVLGGLAWWVRAHEGEEDNMAARIMGLVAGLCFLAVFLIPYRGQIPLVMMFKYFGQGGAEAVILNVGYLILILLGIISILGMFLGGLAKIGKVWAYGITMWWAIFLGLQIAVDVFSSRWVGTWKGRLNVVIRETAPSIICISAAAWGLAFFLHKLTADQQRR
jgi:hypothetical protein